MRGIVMMLAILFCSCNKNSDKTFIDLENCINNYFNVKDYGDGVINKSNRIDYYSLMKKVEDIYLEENFLVNNSKKGYISLINKNNKNVYTKIINLFNNKEFSFFIGVDEILISCPSKFVENHKGGQLKDKFQINLIDEIMASGYRNDDIMIKLINETDEFDNIVYRSSIIYITTIRLFMSNNAI